jgi:hypothetical protein
MELVFHLGSEHGAAGDAPGGDVVGMGVALPVGDEVAGTIVPPTQISASSLWATTTIKPGPPATLALPLQSPCRVRATPLARGTLSR